MVDLLTSRRIPKEIGITVDTEIVLLKLPQSNSGLGSTVVWLSRNRSCCGVINCWTWDNQNSTLVLNNSYLFYTLKRRFELSLYANTSASVQWWESFKYGRSNRIPNHRSSRSACTIHIISRNFAKVENTFRLIVSTSVFLNWQDMLLRNYRRTEKSSNRNVD